MRKILTYSAGLIALYLVVEHYTGAGTLLDKGASGGATVVKALQGR
jgi:hypothetical protein